jgi:DNA-binding response OmpR family regulator
MRSGQSRGVSRTESVGDNVRALHRARIVVASQDRRFVELIGAFLERRGHVIALAPRTDHILGAVEHHGADIVILDAGTSVADAARVAAALESLHPTVRVLVVAEADVAPAADARVLSKWVEPQELVAEIERRYVAAGIASRAAPAW